jgi:hypothetical protein
MSRQVATHVESKQGGKPQIGAKYIKAGPVAVNIGQGRDAHRRFSFFP